MENTGGSPIRTVAHRVASAAAAVLLVANSNLGVGFLGGSAFGQDPFRLEEQLDAVRKRAEVGDPEAQYVYGTMFGEDGQAAAANWFRRAAEQGHIKAQARLGVMYSIGQGVPPDQTAAVKWLARAAGGGQRFAQYYLGRKYARGEGVTRDQAEAIKWLRKASRQKHAVAQFELGKLLERKDRPQALRWYRAAAEQGYVDAQYRLATFLDRVSPQRSRELLSALDSKVGDKGDDESEEQSGRREQEMRVWKREQAEAKKWYKAAAENGHSDAQFYVSKHETEEIEALKWLYLIEGRHRKTMMFDAHDRFEGIYERIRQLEQSLGAGERAEALERAKKWLARQPARNFLLKQLFDAP